MKNVIMDEFISLRQNIFNKSTHSTKKSTVFLFIKMCNLYKKTKEYMSILDKNTLN